jgi:hypothetical protein
MFRIEIKKRVSPAMLAQPITNLNRWAVISARMANEQDAHELAPNKFAVTSVSSEVGRTRDVTSHEGTVRSAPQYSNNPSIESVPHAFTAGDWH